MLTQPYTGVRKAVQFLRPQEFPVKISGDKAPTLSSKIDCQVGSGIHNNHQLRFKLIALVRMIHNMGKVDSGNYETPFFRIMLAYFLVSPLITTTKALDARL